MKNRFAVCVLLLLAGCASAGPGGTARLRVLTYNIHAGKDAAQQRNLDRVAEVIRASAADIVVPVEWEPLARSLARITEALVARGADAARVGVS